MNNENIMPVYQQKWRNHQYETLEIAPNLDPCHKQHNIRWSPEKTGIVVGGFSIYTVLSTFPKYFFNLLSVFVEYFIATILIHNILKVFAIFQKLFHMQLELCDFRQT